MCHNPVYNSLRPCPSATVHTVTDLCINHLHRWRSNQGRITGSSWNWRKQERLGLLQLSLMRMGRKLTLTFLSICRLPLGILMLRDLQASSFPSLKHQRKWKSDPNYTKSWYDRGAKTYHADKYRKGACEKKEENASGAVTVFPVP